MGISLSTRAMAIRRLLSPLVLYFTVLVSLLSTVQADYDEATEVIFPKFGREEAYFLEDTIIVTYINSNRPGPLVVMCSTEHTGSGGSETEWKNVIEVPVIKAPNGTQAIKIQGKDTAKLDMNSFWNWFNCGFKIGRVKDERFPTTKGGFTLMNLTRPGMGPPEYRGITVGEAEASQYSATANLPRTSSVSGTSATLTTTTDSSSSPTVAADTTGDRGMTTSPSSTNEDDISLIGSAAAGPSASSNSGAKDGEGGGGGLSPAAIAGIGAGAGVAVIAVAGLWFLCYWRGRRKALDAAAATTSSHHQQQMEDDQRLGKEDIKTPGSGTSGQLSPSSYYAGQETGYGKKDDKGSPYVSELGAMETERRYEVDGHGVNHGHGWQNRVELA